MTEHTDIAAVVIGRNEGARLTRCLDALSRQVSRIVYVDSGSTDNSVSEAEARGAQVVILDTDAPFTAARARNSGVEAAISTHPAPDFIQFIDGDCEVQEGWIDTARDFLGETSKAAIACGRRRERLPQSSIYNRMIDNEWNTPVGEALACGGDALVRTAALSQVGGYNPALIAGEEPEMCLRLRRAGWSIWRLDAEMTLHDADIHRFGQWWRRAKRAGYTYGEGAAMYGKAPERYKVREARSALVWGAFLPITILLGVLATPWALALILTYPLQVARFRSRGMPWLDATFLVIAKFPEATGVLDYHRRRLLNREARIIEYK